IVWQFKTFPVARARATLPADFIVHGDTIGSGEGRVVNIHLREFSRSEPVRTITLTVWSEEEFMAGLETAAGRIGSWIIRAKAIDLSEELIREYLAGLIGYGDAVTELRRLADLDSSSMPVFALLLDLQKRHVVGNDRDLIETGEKVIALYDPKVGEDTRYLLSLDLDPYDITASVYERWAEWSEAIKLRKLAFQRYPFGRAAHEQKIGMAYLQQGISFEKKGRVDDAMDSFINAMTHLPEQSEPYISAKEAFERLQGHK
nr:hypothetical protein [bacterium]